MLAVEYLIAYHYYMPYRYAGLKANTIYFHTYNIALEQKSLFRTSDDYRHFIRKLQSAAKNRTDLKVAAFYLDRTSYHLVMEAIEVKAIASFLHRLSVAYVMHFNTKYGAKGKLFAGPYKQRELYNLDEVALTTAALHKAPSLFGVEHETYPWSSYRSYLQGNGQWLYKSLLYEYFQDDNPDEIKAFTDSIRPDIIALHLAGKTI